MLGNDRVIYRQLTKEDKQILLVAYNIKREGFKLTNELISKRTRLERKIVDIKVENLHRLGLI